LIHLDACFAVGNADLVNRKAGRYVGR